MHVVCTADGLHGKEGFICFIRAAKLTSAGVTHLPCTSQLGHCHPPTSTSGTATTSTCTNHGEQERTGVLLPLLVDTPCKRTAAYMSCAAPRHATSSCNTCLPALLRVRTRLHLLTSPLSPALCRRGERSSWSAARSSPHGPTVPDQVRPHSACALLAAPSCTPIQHMFRLSHADAVALSDAPSLTVAHATPPHTQMRWPCLMHHRSQSLTPHHLTRRCDGPV
jgi:hypothetical protein